MHNIRQAKNAWRSCEVCRGCQATRFGPGAWGNHAMTKADLARIVYENHGSLTNREALRLVDLVFDVIKERLLQGEEVHIVGFGTLEVVRRKPRRGRNPRTGEEILLSGRRALVFRPSRSIRSV